ncbi:MAG: hypothetical protein IJT59_07295 [Desulfovibrionaceae bacterium]|nr:hypothetical protein [Desulfovibrionaceae bacterium]
MKLTAKVIDVELFKARFDADCVIADAIFVFLHEANERYLPKKRDPLFVIMLQQAAVN